MDYSFTEDEFKAAYDAWGCNCGPSALAFALQIGLDEAHRAIPQFDDRRYTSPTMMRAALANLGRGFKVVPRPTTLNMFSRQVALVRIQWTGPWIVNGKPQKWAARQTHWIATWFTDAVGQPVLSVFDCNGGMRDFASWKQEIVPPLVTSVPRADGGWYPANVWRLDGLNTQPE
jgi:hypothetical protein